MRHQNNEQRGRDAQRKKLSHRRLKSMNINNLLGQLPCVTAVGSGDWLGVRLQGERPIGVSCSDLLSGEQRQPKMKTKIELTDSIQDVLFKMSEGNPGALTVCLGILEHGEKIDPDNAMGGLGIILSLDTLGLYGSKIWMLFRDVCESDLAQMLAMLRGWQLGMLSETQVRHAVENHGDGINVADICQKVTERLPRFQLKPPNIKAHPTAAKASVDGTENL
jgi:hypothetical protein